MQAVPSPASEHPVRRTIEVRTAVQEQLLRLAFSGGLRGSGLHSLDAISLERATELAGLLGTSASIILSDWAALCRQLKGS